MSALYPRPGLIQPTSQSDWDQIAARGFLAPPAPNPTSADVPDVWHQRAEGNTAPYFATPFYPGLLVDMAMNLVTTIKRKALPGSDGVDHHAGEPSSFTSKYFVADNKFLLGLRMRAPYRDEFSAAEGSSAPAGGQPIKMPRPRPWIYKGRVTDWPQAPIQWPTFGEG